MYKWLEKQLEHVNSFYDDPEHLKLLKPWDCPLGFRAELLDCLKFIAKNRLEEFYFCYNGYEFSVEVYEDNFIVYLIDHNDDNSYIPIVRSSYMPEFILNNSNEYFIGSFREKNESEEESADDLTEVNFSTMTKEQIIVNIQILYKTFVDMAEYMESVSDHDSATSYFICANRIHDIFLPIIENNHSKQPTQRPKNFTKK